MKRKALERNSTLKITKGKEYEITKIANVGLVEVINDVGDEVIMSRFSFED